MTVTIQNIGPAEIEAESFRMIEAELGPHDFDAATFAIVRRVIHATGDFSFAENLRFAEGAIDHGIAMLQQGKNILTDVNMVAAAISRKLLLPWQNEVICNIAEDRVQRAAATTNTTRAETAMELGMENDIGIVVIGNAPTALLKVLAMLKSGRTGPPPLVIGVPVGFVNAAESKELLSTTGLPFITSLGRKGGSPVAAAIVNALIRLAAA